MAEEMTHKENAASAKGGRSVASYLLVWARDLTLSLIIAGIVILFIYQPVQVEGTSMEPTLVNRERIFINKFTYRLGFEKISRGDTVVFLYPGDPTKSYIKRVIGVPGDEISIDKGVVYVNGKALEEDYVPSRYRDKNSHMDATLVQPDYYFVLGDHRNSSNDSRYWGQVPRSSIYGKAVFVYWPPDRIGPVE